MKKIKDLLSIEVLKKTDELVEITGSIPAALIEEKRKIIIEEKSKNMQVDGFRKGHLSAEAAAKHLDEMHIWNEGASMVVQEVFPSIVTEYDLNPLGAPSLSFTKTGLQTDVEFKLSVNILPPINLPDYKKIAKETAPLKEVSVKDSDIDTAINDLRRGLYMRDNQGKEVPKEVEKLPEITDEVIKGLSPTCSDIESFRGYLREAIQKQKHDNSVVKRRQKIIDAITKDVNINIPGILIEPEVQSLWQKLEADLKKMGAKMEDHLKKINKTEEELKKLIREDSEKRAKVQLVLNQIALDQEIAPEQDMLDSEFKRFREKNDKNISDEQIKVWLATILTNEEVLSYLEGLNNKEENSV